MLEHSRTGKRELEPTDVNKLITEYSTLAHKASQIKHPSFSCRIGMQLDERIPKLNLVSQEISRVFLNLFNNSLYAVAEKKLQQPDFKPEMNVVTKLQHDYVNIIIRDNGPGIPEKIIEKIFQPFFTTKPPGEGTGLGLSISYDILKAHGGHITVANNAGEGTTFTITLPLKS
jgi:signal transduction histidine kinase